MDVNDLKDYIIGAKKVAKYIDDDCISFSYKETPLIFDWKSEGFRIEYILINDIFNWLCYLGLGDGVIANEEVDYINYYLNLNFSKEELKKLAISKLNNGFINNIPVSFILFCEAEIVDKDLMKSHSVPIYSENLFALFGVLGELFIECDGEITSDERKIYDEYMHLLWQKLTDFKLRRGITDTYDDLVGGDALKEDITIMNNNNLRKKTLDKMNLVLKLLSQGYSLNDLNNISYISIEIIAKWFYNGRLGDKNFKEFYLKSTKLNSTFEIDIDNVLEYIDINHIKDEINPNSKSENIRNTLISEPKNYIFKHQIIDLKSDFKLKEKNIRKLIEKCFPAPQITNSKFNNNVDKCSEMFYHKYENVMIMIDSSSRLSSKLENQIRSNMHILNEINNKLNSLHEELLIKVSKSRESDIEILLEDMGS